MARAEAWVKPKDASVTKENTQDINRYKVAFLDADTKFRIRRTVLAPLTNFLSAAAYLTVPLLPPRAYALDRPIFIVGCSRSGTTVLVDMFKCHCDLAQWSEAGEVADPNYLAPNRSHVRTAEDATSWHARRMRLLFGLYARLSGKRHFVNKHPENSLRLPYLKRIFPDAKFVHVIRDDRATAYSNLRQTMRDRFHQRDPFGYFPKPPSGAGTSACPPSSGSLINGWILSVTCVTRPRPWASATTTPRSVMWTSAPPPGRPLASPRP